MTLLHAVIHGEPVAKRREARKAGGFARVVLAPKSAHWESMAAETLARAWGGKPPTESLVVLQIDAVAPRPKRLMRQKDDAGRIWRGATPDASNAGKAAEDALVKAGVLRDDVQVVDLRVRSLYASKVEGPRVEVRLELAPPAPAMLMEAG